MKNNSVKNYQKEENFYNIQEIIIQRISSLNLKENKEDSFYCPNPVNEEKKGKVNIIKNSNDSLQITEENEKEGKKTKPESGDKKR